MARIATMNHLLSRTAAERRFALLVFEVFALAALALAAAGIYGVCAGSVAERTREIGIRSALGAQPRGIVGLVLGQGMAMTGVGVGLGVLGALAATRTMNSLLFQLSPLDPATYLGAITLVTTVAVLACGVPAWRAAGIDPMEALRDE